MITDEGQWVPPNATFICGVDEVGRGSLAGPVAAAAVIFPRGLIIPGVKDSKKLTPKKRLELFPKILRSSISVGIGYVDSIIIDKWGINYAVVLAMFRAISLLSIVPDWVLVDGFPIPLLPIPQTAIKGGDNLSHAIGAASIVAKVLRDRVMEFFDCLYPQYGFNKNKGYGTAFHIKSIKDYGPSPVHRKSFSPINEFQG
ncbi:MAG: ribonuclease HII [candidate division WOR-3 bacterium]|nr:ribonuclease HII [candidate division WOR-3 bacterium]